MIDGVNIKTGVLADPKASDAAKMKAVAQQFEAVFVRQMLGSMRQAKLDDDIMGSDATDQFREMQDAHVADNLASKGVFGIAEMLQKQFAGRVSATRPGTPAAPAASGNILPAGRKGS
jgi:flagellar protein FlgJ